MKPNNNTKLSTGTLVIRILALLQELDRRMTSGSDQRAASEMLASALDVGQAAATVVGDGLFAALELSGGSEAAIRGIVPKLPLHVLATWCQVGLRSSADHHVGEVVSGADQQLREILQAAAAVRMREIDRAVRGPMN